MKSRANDVKSKIHENTNGTRTNGHREYGNRANGVTPLYTETTIENYKFSNRKKEYLHYIFSL